eukprot:359062-Chlamydomonas_euryale.AAC.23
MSGGEDKTVKLWRISTLECFKTMDTHKEEVTAVAASPDGKYLASASMDCTIKMYKVTSV